MLAPVDRMPTAPAIPPIGVAAAGAAAGAAAAQVANFEGSAVSGSSGGYVFTPEEIEAVIKQWEGLLDDIENDELDARYVASVDAPGEEFASKEFQSAAGPSGDMLNEQIRRMKQYVGDYITALQKAKEATQTTDENAAGQTANAGGEAT